MIEHEQDRRTEQALGVARAMMAAARTAPKARGVDNLEIITVHGDDLRRLADEMVRHGQESGMAFFLRDAENIRGAQAVVIAGTKYIPLGLNCGYCGFPTCAQKDSAIPCAFNTNDLGIALGSAASIAADNRLDSRIMFSVGRAALNLGWLPTANAALGIALSCSGKSPFFDRG